MVGDIDNTFLSNTSGYMYAKGQNSSEKVGVCLYGSDNLGENSHHLVKKIYVQDQVAMENVVC